MLDIVTIKALFDCSFVCFFYWSRDHFHRYQNESVLDEGESYDDRFGARVTCNRLFTDHKHTYRYAYICLSVKNIFRVNTWRIVWAWCGCMKNLCWWVASQPIRVTFHYCSCHEFTTLNLTQTIECTWLPHVRACMNKNVFGFARTSRIHDLDSDGCNSKRQITSHAYLDMITHSKRMKIRLTSKKGYKMWLHWL